MTLAGTTAALRLSAAMILAAALLLVIAAIQSGGNPLGAVHTARAGTTLVVETTVDQPSVPCPSTPKDQNPLTFRCAIEQANLDLSNDTIVFGVSGEIEVKSSLPVLTASFTTIDASHAPGASPNTNAMGSMHGDNAVITVEVDGFSAGSQADGVTFTGRNDTVRGLSVTGFQGVFSNGIAVNGFGIGDGGPGGVVAGNFIGVAPNGTPDGNGTVGVSVEKGTATIGGTNPADANVISAQNAVHSPPNASTGVLLSDSSGSVVEGNYIGTDPSGTKVFTSGGVSYGNAEGVNVFSNSTSTPASNNTIGGTTPDARNIVSGSDFGEYGVDLNASSGTLQNNTVEGNFLGTDVTGTKALANGSAVDLRNDGGATVTDNLIGGAHDLGVCDKACNLISGNKHDGVDVIDAGANPSASITHFNTVQGNFIGTDLTGTTALPNTVGVIILATSGATSGSAAQNNVVGGTDANHANVISGNSNSGIIIAAASNNTVEGNVIGTSPDGTTATGADGKPLGNAFGVALFPDNGIAPAGNTIGGSRASGSATCNGPCNLISGNQGDGVNLSDTSGNFVQGNFIGTTPAGTASLGNGRYGISLSSDGAAGTGQNTIGGTRAGSACDGACNLISGNGQYGIDINNAGANSSLGVTTGNAVAGNFIGTDITGKTVLANQIGVAIVSSSSSLASEQNTIGGTTAGQGNLISGNSNFGVAIQDASENTLAGNLIGADLSGTAKLPNNTGVLVGSDGTLPASGNVVGGSRSGTACTGPCNVISGNTKDGIDIVDVGTNPAFSDTFTTNVEGNYVGANATDSATLGNGRDGIVVDSDGKAPSNGGIGRTRDTGNCDQACNVIVGNAGAGIGIVGATDSDVSGNFIGINAAGDLAQPNGAGVNIQPNGSIQSHDNSVGALVGGEGNVISGNSGPGITILGSSNFVQHNIIGADVTGTKDTGTDGTSLENFGEGVLIQGSNSTPATDNTIGGTGSSGNLISNNDTSGVEMVDAPNNTVQGNIIGADVAGTAALGKQASGVFIFSDGRGPESTGETIGGDHSAGACDTFCNLISGNGTGVEIDDSSGNSVAGNFIGTDINGDKATDASGNPLGNDTGIAVAGSPAGGGASAGNNTIGGAHSANVCDNSCNLISGNVKEGVVVFDADGSAAPSTFTGNTIIGNFIGTKADGTGSVSNGVGIELQGQDGAPVTNTTIGGTAVGTENVISGNAIHDLGTDQEPTSGDGIDIIDAADNTVQFNTIGTDATGDSPISGQQVGVLLEDDGAGPATTGNQIGGTHPKGTCDDDCNLISGNENAGVIVHGASGNFVQGNFIGTNLDGTSATDSTGGSLGNDMGVLLSAATTQTGETKPADDNTIGGDHTAGVCDQECNLISGNTTRGVELNGVDGTTAPDDLTGNTVAGNFVGTDVTGAAAVPNAVGVFLEDGLLADGQSAPTTGTTVGGTSAGLANVISGNADVGVDIVDTSNNTVEGNIIGIDAAGTGVVSSEQTGFGAQVGVRVKSDGDGPDASANTIGGTHSAGTCNNACNLISGNSNGVQVLESSGNTVAGNFIGTDISGTKDTDASGASLGNLDGILIRGSATAGNGEAAAGAGNNTIGGAHTAGVCDGGCNLISGGDAGVDLQGVDGPTPVSGFVGNTILGNFIGTNVSGTAGLGNGLGISLASSGTTPTANTTVGGTGAGAGNLIDASVGNTTVSIPADGIDLVGAINSKILGNTIGQSASGAALDNAGIGISVAEGSTSNTIGMDTPTGAGNVIAFNGHAGVAVGSSATDHSTVDVQGNTIHNNGGLGIDLAPLGTVNCSGPTSGAPNDYTPCPAITSANASGAIKGTACANCIVDVFVATNESDDQGHGEGSTLIGTTSADSSGNWQLDAGIPMGTTAITATATRPGAGSVPAETSEFAANVQLTGTLVQASIPINSGWNSADVPFQSAVLTTASAITNSINNALAPSGGQATSTVNGPHSTFNVQRSTSAVQGSTASQRAIFDAQRSRCGTRGWTHERRAGQVRQTYQGTCSQRLVAESAGSRAVGAVATYVNGRFLLYVPGFSSDFTIGPTQGYFILGTVSGKTWKPTGGAYSSGVPTPLTRGWNLVSMPFPASLGSDVIASQIDSTCSATHACSVKEIAVLGSSGYQVYIPGANTTPFTVPNTAGFWIEMTRATSWTPH